MADEEVQVYALDEGGNKHTTLTTSQILAAVATAIETGQVPTELAAFIDAIEEQNKGGSLKFWVGTQAEFLSLESTSTEIIYFITDSTNVRDLDIALTQLKEQLESGAFVVEKANNVINQINGKNISDIFESDGTTVKEATHADSADAATNVTENINGKAISSIFENDGTTVKEATHADSATNVTGQINGKAITSIFETDGTTVKEATNATRASKTTGGYPLLGYGNTSGAVDYTKWEHTNLTNWQSNAGLDRSIIAFVIDVYDNTDPYDPISLNLAGVIPTIADCIYYMWNVRQGVVYEFSDEGVWRVDYNNSDNDGRLDGTIYFKRLDD